MTSFFNLKPVREYQKSALKKFDCGVEELNIFLARYALKNDTLGIGKTFVASDADGTIAGYFTLSTAQVAFEEIPALSVKKYPRYPLPALRISRLAVKKEYQKKGLGAWLLKQAFLKILNVAEVAGICLILVDAKEEAVTFYEHFGFMKLRNLTYFLPVPTVRSCCEGRRRSR